MGYKHTNTKGVEYHLNTKKIVLRGGKEQSIYYFSKDNRPGTATDLPEGYTVGENKINGFLVLRRETKA